MSYCASSLSHAGFFFRLLNRNKKTDETTGKGETKRRGFFGRRKEKKRPDPVKTEEPPAEEPIAEKPIEEKPEETPVEEKTVEETSGDEAPVADEDGKLEPPEERKSTSDEGDNAQPEGRDTEAAAEEPKPEPAAEEKEVSEEGQSEEREQPEASTPRGLQNTGLLCGCI